MTTTDNAARLREVWGKWDACKGADLSLWEEYMTEDVSLYSLAEGQGPFDFLTPRKGLPEVQEYLKGLTEAFIMQKWQIDETVSEGDRVVGIGSTAWQHRETGKIFDTPVVIVTRWRDGQICEYQEYYDTAMVSACAC